MFCTKCGKKLEGNTADFCPYCGARIENANTYQQPYTYQQMELPMNWYKFVIYFLFFANAVINVIGAIGYFSGSTTSALAEGMVSANWIYAMYPALRGLMYFMGIVALASAVLAIVGRQWMAHFDKRGIIALAVLYIIGIVSNVIYMVGLMTIIQVGIGDLGVTAISSMIGSIVGGVVALVLNMIYFKKRAHLFH